jgi:predicted ATPase
MTECYRIVLTGGPGGGKTTAADLYRREIGESIVIVPEAATLLYSGGFPRGGSNGVRRATQKAIYQVQRNLEDAQSANYQSRILLCDRGTIDGAIYWPDESIEFFKAIGSSLEKELSRYDAVIFFETAAVGNISIEGGNPIRIESNEEALALDHKLKTLWSRHPNFFFIPHHQSFIHKITSGLKEITNMVTHLQCGKKKPG